MNLSSPTRSGSTVVLNKRQRSSIRHLATSILVAYLLSSMMIMALPVSAGRITLPAATASSPAANSFGSAPVSTPESTTILVTVRHSPSINGDVDGSIQQTTDESVDLDKDADIAEDLLVPGTPKVKTSGHPNYHGTVDANGSKSPSGYSVSIGDDATLRHVVRRTDPVTIPDVPEPPAPNGNRHVVINHSSQLAGNFATLEDLIVNQDGRSIAVPPGTYGDFTANNTASFVFGVAGSSTPSVYNLQHLTLNDRSKLQLAGPVVLNVKGLVSVARKATMGSTTDSSLLTLSISRHGLEVGDHGRVFGNVTAPKGLVKIDGSLYGTLVSNRLNLNHGKIFKGVGDSKHVNQAPQVDAGDPQTITLPTNTVNLTGSVTDDGLPKGKVVTSSWSKVSGPGNVTFGNASAVHTTATFSAAGQYVLQLSASDSQLSGSDTVTIVVVAQNQAPVVNAGADQSVQLPNVANLNGTVTDDGLPAGSTVTSTWTKVSGPGSVAFGNASALSTTAAFSAPGQYVLQLSASDSQLSASDTVAVTVIPQNQAPVVNAGPDLTVNLPNVANLNGSVVDDGLGGPLTVAWTKVSGPGTVTFSNASAISTSAAFSAPGQYVLQLSATDSQLSAMDTVAVTVIPQNHAPVVDAGPDQTVNLPGVATLNGAVTDDGLPSGGTLSSTWTKVSGPGTVTFSNPNSPSTSAAFSAPGQYVLQLSASDSQLSSSDTVAVTVIPQNHAPVVDAGPDQTVNLPGVATLNGAVTDDGLPSGGTLSSTWTKVSGPGTVTFSNPNSPSTSAAFSAPGQYVLQLSASDSQLSTSATVSITVIPQNHAPVVDAGPDQTVNLPNVATLNGAVTDDGLPSGGTLTSTWSKVSGPGTVTFSNPNSPSTTAAFSAPGQYVLQLSASDSQLSTSATLSITVIPQNHAPVVDAGPDQTVNLPNVANLNGTVTDDGLPSGGTLTSTWSKVSGPGTVTFSNANSTSTTASFSAPGQYVLQLSASDSQLSTSATLNVTVIPQNQPPVVNAGADQTVQLPALANLNGTVTDDGLPSGSTLTLTWTKVSGPGTVTFGNANLASTTAQFSAPGNYVLRLTASDSLLSSSADVNVTVLASVPVVNAGPNQTITLPSTGLNGSADDQVNPPSSLIYQWSMVSGPASPLFGNSSSPVTTALFPVAGAYVLRLSASNGQQTGSADVTINVLPGCITVPSGLAGWWAGEGDANDSSHNNNNGQLPNGVTFTSGKVGQEFKFNGTNFVQIPDNPTLKPTAVTIDTWVKFDSLDTTGASSAGLQYLVFKQNSRTFSFEGYALQKNRVAGVDRFQFYVSSASGVQQIATSTTSVVPGQFYHVAGTYDGNNVKLYVNGVLESNVIGGLPLDYGTNPVYLGTSGQSFFDGKLTGQLDEVHLFNRALSGSEIQSIFQANNFGICQQFTASAGQNQTVSLPNATANLNGSATDMFNPNAAIDLLWSVASGPGQVSFGNPTVGATTAQFNVAGTYVLRLTATEGDLSAESTVTVNVLSPCDQVPAGLVGWWRGEGNANDFLNQNNGVQINSPGFVPAVVGQGFKFNGTNSVQIPDSASLKPATVTVDAWVKFDSLDAPGASQPGLQFLVFKRNTRTSSFEGYTLLKQRVNGQDRLRFYVTSVGAVQAIATSTTTVTTGVFYHVVGTYDGAAVKLYVNGVLEGQTAANFPIDYGTRPVFLGTSGESFDGKLMGVLDEIHIFNRALSASEVQSIFASATGGVCTSAMNLMPVFNSLSAAPTTIARNTSPNFGGRQNQSFTLRTRPAAREVAEKPTGSGTY